MKKVSLEYDITVYIILGLLLVLSVMLFMFLNKRTSILTEHFARRKPTAAQLAAAKKKEEDRLASVRAKTAKAKRERQEELDATKAGKGTILSAKELNNQVNNAYKNKPNLIKAASQGLKKYTVKYYKKSPDSEIFKNIKTLVNSKSNIIRFETYKASMNESVLIYNNIDKYTITHSDVKGNETKIRNLINKLS